MPLQAQIERIRSYTKAHAELTKAHHFLYDVHLLPGSVSCDYVVMGLNPGEQKDDWKEWPERTEESSDFDFRRKLGHRPAASRNWRSNVEFFCGTTNVVMGELFLWSSASSGDAFKEKFGTKLERSPHLQFCRDVNVALVNHYRPIAVLATGVTLSRQLSEVYGLTHVRTIRAEDRGRLVEHYSLDGRPWIFTKHWSGSRGFTTLQRNAIRAYIAGVT